MNYWRIQNNPLKFSELQLNRQLNKIKKTMYEQNEKFHKEIAIIKKKTPRVEKYNNWTQDSKGFQTQ